MDISYALNFLNKDLYHFINLHPSDVYLSIQVEVLIHRSVRYLNIIENLGIHKVLNQPAYIEAKTYVDVAPAIVRAALLVILVMASVMSHVKLQILQIRIADEIESIGFDGY